MAGISKKGEIMRTLITLCIMGMLLVAACAQAPPPTGEDTYQVNDNVELSGSTQELKKFESVEELRDFLKENQGQSYGYDEWGGMRGGVMMEMAADVAMAPQAMGATKSASNGADDYSTTNVQVEGVDEADFVKNDDKYIYLLSGDNLVIVDAYPAEDADILSKTDIDGQPRDMFVHGDTLVVFVDRNDYVYALPEFDIMPRPHYTQQLHVMVYDIADREDPELEDEFTINGRYLQSRMIGEHVYFLTQENVRMYDYWPDVPVIRDADSVVVRPEIYYFDNPEDNYQFVTVASLALSDLDVEAKSYLMGYASTIFVSQDNLYVSYQKNMPWRYYEDEKEEKFWDVVVPELPASVRSQINAVKDDDLNAAEEWGLIREILQDMYDEMDEDDAADLVEDINDAVREWEWDREEERRKTIIHKIAVDEGDIDYVAKGEVKGQLLNQFSMDEYNGDLRVATTTYVYSRQGSTQWNNVYVLDEDMDMIGELEGLAEDERIYSTRFMGERLYMVTFQRIDPLFVIDLSNPRDPEVLGELKIPGFSDYLHPYDENHLIGVGKETKENEWGGVSLKGVKVSLFDVSDVENPRQVDVIEIGGPGSTTEVSQDHKAFLFDRDKQVMVLPVREVKEDWRWEDRWRYSNQRVWQGAYVYTVTENGFEKRGKVSHYEGSEESRWYWGSPAAVRRSLYMDDVLYTISQRTIEMHDIDSVEEINDLDLPYSEPDYRHYPEPMPFVDVDWVE